MKDNKSKRKNFKGMTLIEIIVSLAVLSAMTLVLVQTSTVIDKFLRSSNSVNRKTVDQSPVAEANITKKMEDGGLAEECGEAWVIVGVPEQNIGMNASGDVIKNDAGNPKVGLKGTAYKVNQAEEDAYDELGGDLHMQFVVLDGIVINNEWKETESSTTPSSEEPEEGGE